MIIKTIINPETNQSIEVFSWLIIPRDILRKLREKEIKGARGISWALLSDEDSQAHLEEDLEAPGDSSQTSFALLIVAHALDWRLGCAVLEFIYAFLGKKRLPLPFEVSFSNHGDVFIIRKNGKVLKM